MQAPNTTITAGVGKIAKNGTVCADYGYAHLHQSGDVSSSSYMVGAGYYGDTCWAPTDDRCNSGGGLYYGDHLYCPLGWQPGWLPRTGTIPEYICAEWQIVGSYKDLAAFIIRY
jgi:hypothetical protein